MLPNVPSRRPHNPITEMFNRLNREALAPAVVSDLDGPNVAAKIPRALENIDLAASNPRNEPTDPSWPALKRTS